MSNVKKSIICAACIALCYILPLFFHGIQDAGSIFCPMHIPVFICGLICGGPYGLLCGLAGPAMSSLLTGMPSIAYLPVMMIELGMYGLISGISMKKIHLGKTGADLYVCLVLAILAGRIAAGAAKALIFSSGSYSVAMWVASYVVTSWPGTLIQLIFIPAIVMALMQARLVPRRYVREKGSWFI